MTQWDPAQYLQNEDHRTRPAIDLLNRIWLEAPSRIVDLGCGPGNSTDLLARRWPTAALTGVDNSQAMLEQARRRDLPARWQLCAIEDWAPKDQADLIFSNAALHWVSDHKRLFPALAEKVSVGGVLAVQMPYNFSSPSHQTIARVASDGPWAGEIGHLHKEKHQIVQTPEQYADILYSAFGSVDIWTTEYMHMLDGDNAVYEWVLGTALRPYVSTLSDPQRDAFLDACRTALARAYPPDKNGRTKFPFKRLFLVAGRH